MKVVENNETFISTSGDLFLNSTIGNGHIGSIDVRINNRFIIRKVNEPVVNLNLFQEKGLLKITSIVNKVTDLDAIVSHKLNDDSNTKFYEYTESFDGESAVKFITKISVQ